MPDFEIEDKVAKKTVGIDEAGRGSWAGPVVAGAVIFLDRDIHPELISGLDDSKKLSAKKRDKLYDILISEAKLGKLSYGIGEASPEEIDSVNILQATFLAMKRALDKVDAVVEFALIDGNQKPKTIDIDCKTVVKGDGKSYSIAAASIFAKVYRDRLMAEYAKEYPQYLFEKNAGYGTKAHIAALKEFGVTPIHRKSYKPILALL